MKRFSLDDSIDSIDHDHWLLSRYKVGHLWRGFLAKLSWRRQGNTADTLPGARRPGVWDYCHFSMITILCRLVVAFSMNTIVKIIVIWGSWVPLKEMLFASTSLSRVWGARRLCVFHDDDREYNCDHEKGTQVTLERDVVCLNISFKGLRCLETLCFPWRWPWI